MKKLTAILTIFLIAASASGGRWAQPPEYVIVETEANGLFLRKCNRLGVIEIREAKELGLVSKIKIDDFSELFSSFHLTPDGEKLIHVKGNHMVNEIDEYCIEIYTSKGKVDAYRASEIYNELPPIKGVRTSACPKYLWKRKVVRVSNDSILIETNTAGTFSFTLDGHGISKTLTDEQIRNMRLADIYAKFKTVELGKHQEFRHIRLFASPENYGSVLVSGVLLQENEANLRDIILRGDIPIPVTWELRIVNSEFWDRLNGIEPLKAEQVGGDQ